MSEQRAREWWNAHWTQSDGAAIASLTRLLASERDEVEAQRDEAREQIATLRWLLSCAPVFRAREDYVGSQAEMVDRWWGQCIAALTDTAAAAQAHDAQVYARGFEAAREMAAMVANEDTQVGVSKGGGLTQAAAEMAALLTRKSIAKGIRALSPPGAE